MVRTLRWPSSKERREGDLGQPARPSIKGRSSHSGGQSESSAPPRSLPSSGLPAEAVAGRRLWRLVPPGKRTTFTKSGNPRCSNIRRSV